MVGCWCKQGELGAAGVVLDGFDVLLLDSFPISRLPHDSSALRPGFIKEYDLTRHFVAFPICHLARSAGSPGFTLCRGRIRLAETGAEESNERSKHIRAPVREAANP